MTAKNDINLALKQFFSAKAGKPQPKIAQEDKGKFGEELDKANELLAGKTQSQQTLNDLGLTFFDSLTSQRNLNFSDNTIAPNFGTLGGVEGFNIGDSNEVLENNPNSGFSKYFAAQRQQILSAINQKHFQFKGPKLPHVLEEEFNEAVIKSQTPTPSSDTEIKEKSQLFFNYAETQLDILVEETSEDGIQKSTTQIAISTFSLSFFAHTYESVDSVDEISKLAVKTDELYQKEDNEYKHEALGSILSFLLELLDSIRNGNPFNFVEDDENSEVNFGEIETSKRLDMAQVIDAATSKIDSADGSAVNENLELNTDSEAVPSETATDDLTIPSEN